MMYTACLQHCTSAHAHIFPGVRAAARCSRLLRSHGSGGSAKTIVCIGQRYRLEAVPLCDTHSCDASTIQSDDARTVALRCLQAKHHHTSLSCQATAPRQMGFAVTRLHDSRDCRSCANSQNCAFHLAMLMLDMNNDPVKVCSARCFHIIAVGRHTVTVLMTFWQSRQRVVVGHELYSLQLGRQAEALLCKTISTLRLPRSTVNEALTCVMKRRYSAARRRVMKTKVSPNTTYNKQARMLGAVGRTRLNAYPTHPSGQRACAKLSAHA